MLIELFVDCLPNRKKRRYHFNTFMLDTLSRLESLRKSRTSGLQDEYPLLWLARNLIQTSPILFLDEFQLPDRAASKILSNLLTSFFQLGGVLIATSNRMPEELAKAAGMEFARPVRSTLGRWGWRFGARGGGFGAGRRDDGAGQKGEFAQFLEVLKARCVVWEMEGKKDYRRIADEAKDGGMLEIETTNRGPGTLQHPSGASVALSEGVSTDESTPFENNDVEGTTKLPRYYHISPSSSSTPTPGHIALLLNLPWTPHTLTIYSRTHHIPRSHLPSKTALFTFSQLCGTNLGPADYISLASTYHTLILTDVPVLGFLQKNEARRFITLLDALYEARCRLCVTAETGPDDILFPEKKKSSPGSNEDGEKLDDEDVLHSETYSEIHQDLTTPFRPNVSLYDSSASQPSLADDALEDDPPNRFRRPGSSYTDERRLDSETRGATHPNFKDLTGLTGEDERFAVARARSRLWEMCSARWWARGPDPRHQPQSQGKDQMQNRVQEEEGGEVESWWRPLPRELRHWEGDRSEREEVITASQNAGVSHIAASDVKDLGSSDLKEGMFRHGASPFRTAEEAPPKIEWTHVWGTVKWGKRAGAWGKGVEGLGEREKELEKRKEHDGNVDADVHDANKKG